MKRFALLFLGLALLAMRASAVPLSEAGPEIVAGHNDAAWEPLFAALANKGAIDSRFTERRWFPFRRKPVVVAGEMRLAPGHGLSLHYSQPEDRTVIVDDRGLAFRDAAGRLQAGPSDPRATAAIGALLPVLRFDRAELAKTFVLAAARDGDDWRLDFVPREAALARLLGRIVVFGAGDAVRRIELRHSAHQHIEIEIGETATHVQFATADLQRYFR